MGNWLTLLGSGVSTAGNVASQILANLQNQQMNAANQEFQQKQWERENNAAIEAANEADRKTRALYTDLQSPLAMRKQLEEAGLSVGMMYGQGGMQGSLQNGAQAQVPSKNAPNKIPMNPIFDANAASIVAQTALMQAQTRKTNAEAANDEENLPNIKKQGLLLDKTIEEKEEVIDNLQWERQEIQSRIENVNMDTKVKESVKNLNEAQEKLANIDLKTREQINEENLKILQETVKKLKEEQETLKSQRRLNNANANKANEEAKTEGVNRRLLWQTWSINERTFEAQVQLKTAELEKTLLDCGHSKALIDKIKQEARLAKNEADMQQRMERVYKQYSVDGSDARARVKFAGEIFRVLNPLSGLIGE